MLLLPAANLYVSIIPGCAMLFVINFLYVLCLQSNDAGLRPVEGILYQNAWRTRFCRQTLLHPLSAVYSILWQHFKRINESKTILTSDLSSSHVQVVVVDDEDRENEGDLIMAVGLEHFFWSYMLAQVHTRIDSSYRHTKTIRQGSARVQTHSCLFSCFYLRCFVCLCLCLFSFVVACVFCCVCLA